MALEEGLLLPMQLQAIEVARVIQESADLELANRMQLEEVLAISVAMALASSTRSSEEGSTSTESKRQEDGSEAGELSGVEVCSKGAVSDDRNTAISEQQLEAEKLKQELEDEVEALKEQSRLAEVNAIAEHDSRFARFLSSLSEAEWESNGKNLDDPFTFHSEDIKKAIVEALPRICEEAPHLKGKAISLDTDVGTSYHCSADVWEPAVAAASLLDLPETSYLARISGRIGGSGSSDNESGILTCKICFTSDLTPRNSEVVSEKCLHRFCRDCLRQHGETMVKAGKSYIPCPYFDCGELYSAEICQRLLHRRSLRIITQRQVEDAIPQSDRVYCPFKDCSALNLKPATDNPTGPSSSPEGTVGGVECLSCNRYFCLECQVPWHGDLTCEEYQALPPDERSPLDLALLKGLAKEKNWQRCTCGFLVELRAGCNHITCRCGNEFCYICGGDWKANDHTCQKF